MCQNCHRLLSVWFLSLFALSLNAVSAAGKDVYDPLAVPDDAETKTIDMSINDKKRDRKIPIRVYMPAGKTPAPIVLFSHGLGGSREGCSYLGKHWSARGYVAVFLQHPGSDTSVWKGKPAHKRMAALKKAANARNFKHRVKDVVCVLDRLEKWDNTVDHTLGGRLDFGRVGMSGHSFGAVTTQAVSGQVFWFRKRFSDSRIKAAIMMSPSPPHGGGDPNKAFRKVKRPWMLMTGTKDTAEIGDTDVEDRLSVFPALPAGDKYQLVLHNAEHSAFTEKALWRDTGERNPNHHRAILALSTAFWDTYLRGDKKARAWLKGDDSRSVLEKKDRWQKR
ncbi:MAG: dienelactone hydrolase [Planctomycetes bacterium]|nr:dienelactone hydrolase [Planctomycetota bacterium]